MPKTHI